MSDVGGRHEWCGWDAWVMQVGCMSTKYFNLFRYDVTRCFCSDFYEWKNPILVRKFKDDSDTYRNNPGRNWHQIIKITYESEEKTQKNLTQLKIRKFYLNRTQRENIGKIWQPIKTTRMNLTVEKRTEVFVKLLNNFILEEKNMESTDKGKARNERKE